MNMIHLFFFKEFSVIGPIQYFVLRRKGREQFSDTMQSFTSIIFLNLFPPEELLK